MKKQITFIVIIFLSFPLLAQDKSNSVYNSKKWIVNIGLAHGMYMYKGIPESRNEINCHAKGIVVNQTKGRGPVLNGAIQYKLNKNFIGFTFNYYKDTKNSSKTMDQTIYDIESNGTSKLTIYDNHCYFNIGLSYQRQIKSWKNDRVSLNALLAGGYSINFTPQRLEYDYLLHDFVTVDTSAGGATLKLSSLTFKNGYFIHPAFNLKYNFSSNQGLILELGAMYQSHKMYYSYFAEGMYKGYSPSTISKYSVMGLQLKLNYFFNF